MLSPSPVRILVLSATTLGLLLASAAALATEAELDRDAVQRHLTRAGVYLEDGDCPRAIEEFDIIDPWFRENGDLAQFRWNYARCLKAVDRPIEAVESFRLILKLDVPSATHDAARAEIAALRKDVLGQVSLTCDVEHARVDIEGTGLEGLPCPVQQQDVRPGIHRLVVTAPSGNRWQRSVTVVAGKESRMSARVPATLEILSPVPGSHVQVDGRYVGQAGPDDPLVVRDLAARGHRVRVTPPDGQEPWTGRMKLLPGQSARVTAGLEPPPAPPETEPEVAAEVVERPAASPKQQAEEEDNTALWVGLGIGVGAAVVATAFGFLLLSDDEPTPDPVDVRFFGE